MKLYLHIVNDENLNKCTTYDLTTNNINEISISEYDLILFEVISDNRLSIINSKFILGNTVLGFDNNLRVDEDKYYYYLSENDIENIVLTEAFIKNINFQGSSTPKKFSKLFMNEIGNCTPIIKTEIGIFNFDTIHINSPKINDVNFKIIIEYLMFNNYFDEKILYKNTLDSIENNLNNSFLESLKKLLKFSEDIVDNLFKFKIDPIQKMINNYVISDYNHSSNLDDNSINWLFDNINVIKKQKHFISQKTFYLKNHKYEIEQILQSEVSYTYNTYENQIILGFLDLLLSLIKNKIEEFEENKYLRTRINSFSEYLTKNLNEIISFYLKKISDNFLNISLFFQNELRVNEKLFGFPSKIDGFLTKPHYILFLDLMLFSKNLFSLKTNNKTNFKLEIESFDKLFEVYCLYILKDSIHTLLGMNSYIVFEPNQYIQNKISGKFQFKKNNFDVNLYYEGMPDNILQLVRTTKKYYERPDFVIEIKNNNNYIYIILDAKYKKYSKKNFNDDISSLTFKYLHKIGVVDPKSNKVVGLYTISINSNNTYKSIFDENYDLFGPNPVFPQIGSLEVNPKNINIKTNIFTEFLKKYIKLTEDNQIFD